MTDSVDRLLTVRWERIDKDLPYGLTWPKHKGDVGFDLHAVKGMRLKPGEVKDIPFNIKLWLPDGVWAEVRARSSIVKRGLMVDAGTIDNGYRGPLYAVTRNMNTPQIEDLMELKHLNRGATRTDLHDVLALEKWIKNNTVHVKRGDRIAQIVFHRITDITSEEVEHVPDDSSRGAAGFGSTGT